MHSLMTNRSTHISLGINGAQELSREVLDRAGHCMFSQQLPVRPESGEPTQREASEL